MDQRRIGLTGGIASGKSTVGRLLAERGLPVLDADGYAREALAPGSPGAAAVLELGRALAAAAAANAVLTVALNLGFMSVWGVVGIAAATTPAFVATALVLYLAVDRALSDRR